MFSFWPISNEIPTIRDRKMNRSNKRAFQEHFLLGGRDFSLSVKISRRSAAVWGMFFFSRCCKEFGLLAPHDDMDTQQKIAETRARVLQDISGLNAAQCKRVRRELTL
jgi:hypothetical protein